MMPKIIIGQNEWMIWQSCFARLSYDMLVIRHRVSFAVFHKRARVQENILQYASNRHLADNATTNDNKG